MTLTSTTDRTGVSRRGVLGGLIAGGGLILSAGALAQDRRGGETGFGAWLRIAPDGAVTILMSQSEMGQGISTTLPAALADELGADWSRVKTEWSPFDPAYRHPQYGWMFTGNSESSSTFYPIMRRMGAAAREMLTAAAAERLGGPAERLTVRDGVITDPVSGRSVGFGAVAEAAARLPVPKAPRIKSDAELRLVGRPQARLDVPAKVDGSAVFGIDAKVPGMLVAAIRRAPSPGGALVRYDKAAILARPGVRAVVEIGSGLAVVADRYWTAKSALDAGRLEFADGPLAGYSTEAQRAKDQASLTAGPFATKKKTGDAPAVLAAAPKTLEAVYEIPAQAHATMEPMNCTAHVTADRCELWAPTQGMEITHEVAKQITGLPDDRIVIHRTLLGGGFGRRLLADFARIAIEVSREAKAPVKVVWSREEDFAYDAFRPPMTHRLHAALGPDGAPTALHQQVVSASHLQYVFPRTKMPGFQGPWDRPVPPPQAYDGMAVEGLVDAPYAIPNALIEQHFVESPLSVSVWRTTGHGPNNFALEAFIDELAHAAGRDPLDYRLGLAKGDARAVAVLKAVAEMADWRRRRPGGIGRGIAMAKAFNGYVAQVVEVRLKKGGEVKVTRIWCALDVGKTLDPGIAAANTEGGIVWGLSGLRTEAAFVGGRPVATNFDRFDPLHLWETPAIEARFIDSGAPVGGTGELGPVPTHAAFANAVFAAGGPRIRRLPISRHGLRLV